MANKTDLVIVESPSKAKTIGKYLGPGYEVKASMGHVRDLPKSKLGVDLEKGDFEPNYQPIKGKEDVISDLKKAAKKSGRVYLATDPDREGEAISWHLKELLKLPEFRDADKAHELMSFLTDSKENLPMPDEGPMKILIGPENVSEALKDASVVVASYDIGDDMRGLIGVVGPTRMDYATVAARLTGFAEGLTRLFGKQELPPKEEQEQ